MAPLRQSRWLFDESCKAGGGEAEILFRGLSGKRKWRWDWAWPKSKLAIEIQGGTWTRGKHTRALGYSNDCHKLAQAVLLGWRVLWVTSDMIRDGTAFTYLEGLLRGNSVAGEPRTNQADANMSRQGDSRARRAAG